MHLFGHRRSQKPRNAKTPRPILEQLEDRIVPSTMLDVTTRGAVASVSLADRPEDGPVAIFRQTDAQPTGTGVIQSFLRMETKGSKNTVEQGFNTDARPLQFDEKTDHNFTRSIRLDDIPVVTINGVRYREFLLDVNQPGSSSKISLDQLRFFTADTPDLTGYNTTTNTLAGRAAVFDLDAVNAGETGDTRWVRIDARLNSGSGSGDVYVDIADRFFSRSGSNPYVYLFSRFGDNVAARAGFEEWAVVKSQDAASNVATLSGTVTTTTGEGVAGITITLSGLSDEGTAIVLTAITDADGYYQFTDVPAGTYSLVETLPDIYVANSATPGTVDGSNPDGTSVEPESITDVILAGGDIGIHFNFIVGFNE